MVAKQNHPGAAKSISGVGKPAANLTLNDYRMRANLTLRAFATHTGCSAAFVQQLCNGQHATLEPEQARQCANLLGITLQEIGDALTFVQQQRQMPVALLRLSPGQAQTLRQMARSPECGAVALGLTALQSPTHAALQSLGLLRCIPGPGPDWVHTQVQLTAGGHLWLAYHPATPEEKESPRNVH